jgi:endonuclease/exonuclease/phosphatase family metal-dependent hydrolase
MSVALFSITAVVSARGETPDLKVMSFNVRYSTSGAGEKKAENNWSDPSHPRRERVIRVIQDFEPDLLDVQEARNHQIKDLQKALSDYDFYGIGRDDGKTAGEYSGIFYRRDRFRREDQGSFWLSETPATPGTTFRARRGSVPRIASWVKLVDQSTGREFLLLNMHWDNASEPARRKSAALVRKRLATLAKDRPAIVTGDLNAFEDTPALKTLINGDGEDAISLTDSFRYVHPVRRPDEATHHNWEGTTKGSRIDFILTTPEFEPTTAEIVRTTYDGLVPSDHYPVTATLRWRDAE